MDGRGIVNLPPSAPTNLSTLQDSTGMYLRWNPGNDDHSPTDALTFDVILYKDGNTITKGLISLENGSRLKLQQGRNFTSLYLKTLVPGEYTWKVQAIDQNFLGSALSVEGSFIFRPLQPTIGSDTLLYNCNHLATIAAKGENIEWFSDRNATLKIASGEFHPTKTQVVYVTQTVNGIKGFAKRVAIRVEDRPPKPIILSTNPLPFCEYEAGFVGKIESQGEFTRWYSDANKTGFLGYSTELVIVAEEKNYFVTQTIQGCESDVEVARVFEKTIQSTVRFEKGNLVTLELKGDYYEWFLNEKSIPGSNSYFIEPKVEGAYVVGIIKDYCYEFSPPFVINGVGPDLPTELQIYPNPTIEEFNVEIPTMEIANLQIIDVNGRIIYKRVIENTESKAIKISSTDWSPGIYLISVTDGKSKLSGKILKR